MSTRQRRQPLPNSPEAERAILGGILLNNAVYQQASESLNDRDFFLDSNRKIYAVIHELVAKGVGADMVTVAEGLARRRELDGIGGPGYISSLTDDLPRLSNIQHYAKIVRDKALLRRAIYAAQEIAKQAQGEPEDVGKFLASARERLPVLSANGNRGPIQLTVLSVEELLKREIKPREMLLDPILPEQGLMMLYARRGDGKTYFSLSIAVAVASGGTFLCWKAPRPRNVLYIDGELPAITLKERCAMIVPSSEKEPAPGALRFITPDVQEGPMPDLATAEGQAVIEPYLEGVDFLILDNLSALCRQGKENESEGWLPVQEWLLTLRRRGKAVLFDHHAGKSGTQRGTSMREDLLDTVLSLKRPADYISSEGLRCEVHFEKTRAMFGDGAKPFEVKLETGPSGAAVWTMRALGDVKRKQAFELFSREAKVREVAEALGISRANAGRIRREWDKK